MDSSSYKFEVIHQTILEQNNTLNISYLCDIANVSRSGYYRWLNAGEVRQGREVQDQKDFDIILSAYTFRGYNKGARGIYMRLLHLKPMVIINIKKIRRLMKKYQLFCPIRKANPYRRMAKAMKTNQYAENILQREFTVHGPRQILLTDITYIPYCGIHCYLSSILDAHTRQVLAYVLSESLEIDFVLKTVQILVQNHGISLSTSTLIHSDQGPHYTSLKFIQIINDSNLRQSMSRRGNCWDNAPQESFFGHMKDEINISNCRSFAEVEEIIDDWISYYNNDRYQWQLAKLSPNEYYQYTISGVYPLKGITSPQPELITNTFYSLL